MTLKGRPQPPFIVPPGSKPALHQESGVEFVERSLREPLPVSLPAMEQIFVEEVHAGSHVTITGTQANPIVNAGGMTAIVAGHNISVDTSSGTETPTVNSGVAGFIKAHGIANAPVGVGTTFADTLSFSTTDVNTATTVDIANSWTKAPAQLNYANHTRLIVSIQVSAAITSPSPNTNPNLIAFGLTATTPSTDYFSPWAYPIPDLSGGYSELAAAFSFVIPCYYDTGDGQISFGYRTRSNTAGPTTVTFNSGVVAIALIGYETL